MRIAHANPGEISREGLAVVMPRGLPAPQSAAVVWSGSQEPVHAIVRAFHPITPTQLWFSISVIALLSGIAIYTWQFRKERGALPHVYVQACRGGWVLALVLASVSTGFVARLFWINTYQILAILLSFLWFRFISQLSGLDRRLPAWLNRAMLVWVGLLWLAILTNAWHGWYWKSAWAEGNVVRTVFGPAAYVTLITAYGMNLVSAAVNVIWALRCVGLRRTQAWLFLAPTLIGWLGHFITNLPVSRLLAPAPACFFLSGLLTAWAFYRWRVYGIVPLAQDTVLRTMIDGLVVVDEQNYVVELNPAAESMLGRAGANPGISFDELCRPWPELSTVQSGETAIELERVSGGNLRSYQVMATPLHSDSGHLLGRVVVIKDITQQKEQQARIVRQEKILSILEERERLSRELHDGPGQQWGFVAMQAQAARILLAKGDREQADQLLERLIHVTQSTHIDLRESISALRTGISGERNFLQAVSEQLAWYRQYGGLESDLCLEGEWPSDLLSTSAEVQLLGIVQEAPMNVRKSAAASRVRVVIGRNGTDLSIVVEDDGCGLAPKGTMQRTGHHGLRIMQERATEVGARLSITSEPGKGTRVCIQVPVPSLS